MTELIVKGEAFNVVVEGREGAPAVMLAHSLGTNLHLFDKLVGPLARHFRLIRYDARGHGSSVVTPGPYSLDQLGRDTLGILDTLGVENVHWIGVSAGAMVGLWLLTHAWERIGRAVLAGVAAQLGGSDMWNERIRSVRERGMESVVPSTLDNWFTKSFREHHPDEIERISKMLLAAPEEGYTGLCAAIRDMDQRETIRGITNPVLVVVGRHDPLTTPGLGALVASAIQGAKLVTLDTAHMSCIEDPEGFDQAAIEFLTTEAPVMGEEPKHEAGSEAPHAPHPPQPKPERPKPPSQPASGGGAGGSMPPQPVAQPRPMPAPMPSAGVSPTPAPAAPAKKSAAKKAGRKATKKAPAKKRRAAAARKGVAKKSAAKKGARKAGKKRSAAKKSSARKAVGKRTQAKRGAKKGAAKKSGGRKPLGRHTPGRRSGRKR